MQVKRAHELRGAHRGFSGRKLFGTIIDLTLDQFRYSSH